MDETTIPPARPAASRATRTASVTGHGPVAASLWRTLGPLCSVVFFQFLAMGLPLTALPVHVSGTLGFSSLVVGVVVGAQSAVTLITRHRSGRRSDVHGPLHAVRLGLLASAGAGATYALSLAVDAPALSLTVLLLGRGLLGLGESLVIVGALAWGVELAGRERAGRVMAWVGIAMYAALALGAPLGSALDASWGLGALTVAAMMAPLVGIAIARLVPPVRPAPGPRIAFLQLVRMVWLPGTGLALAAVGFGAIAGFSALTYAERGWAGAAMPMTAFGVAYVLARVLFGGLPDRVGGPPVAVAAVALAAAGQLGMWLAPTPMIAAASAAATGFGFSLAFPSFGVEAMRWVPPTSRGVALGAYVAFFDATMGFGVPAMGAAVGVHGYRAAYVTGFVAAVLSLATAVLLLLRSRIATPSLAKGPT